MSFEGRIEHFTQQVCSLLSPTFLFAQCEKSIFYYIFFFQNHLQKHCAFEFLLLVYFFLFALNVVWTDNIFSAALCVYMLVGVCEKADLFNTVLNVFSPFCCENS